MMVFWLLPRLLNTWLGKLKRKFCPNINFSSSSHGSKSLLLRLYVTNTYRPLNIPPVVGYLPSHDERLSNAPVSSMLPLDPRTFVPPRWKLSPNCALGVNDQRDRVAWFNTGTYARHALPQPFCVERRVLPGVPWVATSACVRIGNVSSEKQ